VSALKLSPRPDADGPARRRPRRTTARPVCAGPSAPARLSPRPAARASLPFLLVALLALTTLLAGCGKRKPPQPPVERVPQRTELLSGIQRGNRVILNWPAPRRNAPDGSVQSIRRIDVYRLAEPTGAPETLTEEEFGARATLIGSVPFEAIQSGDGTVTYTDELELTELVRLRYALRYVNASGQRAAFSNFLLVEPAATVSLPPTLVPEPALTESAVTLRWEAPRANIDGSTPPNLLGYNVYRATRSQDVSAQVPLNGERPLTETQFADQSFAFGEEYVYVVRAVSLGTGGQSVESLNSNSAQITPVDKFAPAAPSGVTVGPAGGRLSIFWAANVERDVAGYHLYRSTDADLPLDGWTKLNRTLLDRTTYQDDSVQSGVKYFYYLTAVDSAGNVSQPSDVASETVP